MSVDHHYPPSLQLSQNRPPITRPVLPAIQSEPEKETGSEKEVEPGKKVSLPTDEEVKPPEKAESEHEDSSSSGSGSSTSVHSEQEQAS